MNATGSTVKKSGGSTAVVISLAVAALIAWAGGGTVLGALFTVVLLVYLVTRPSPAAPTAGDLAARVTHLEFRVDELQRLVRRPAPTAAPAPERRPEAAPPAPPKPKVAPAAPVLPSRATFEWGRSISVADLMGAKALAFAGGVVTLLGVVFFFVLAVNRGWIGPGMRVAFGGLASGIVFGAGLWLQRRYERTYSALAAVGTGIAGAYVTLLAAVSLYELLSKPVALIVAAAIASVGVAVSLAWESQVVAGFGLVGAMIVPATLVFQGGLEEVGTAFVAIVFAGAAVVAVRQRWWKLLQISALVSAPQALGQIADATGPQAGIVALAVVFWLLYVAAGIAFQLRLGRGLAAAPASFLLGGAVFAGISAEVLYNWQQQGHALLVPALAYVLIGAALFRSRRELATLLWTLGLGLGAVGLAETLSGSSLTYAWAAEAVILAWLSSRVRDARFQLAALVYLGLALVHAIAVEANPHLLFDAAAHPAKGAPAVVVIAFAAVVFAVVERSWAQEPSKGILRALDPLLVWLRANERQVGTAAFAFASLLTTYAISLGVLELFQEAKIGATLEARFEWGHVAINLLWAMAGLAAVTAGLRRRSEIVFALGLLGLALTVGKVLAFDVARIDDTRYAISLLIVGAAALAAGLLRELAKPGDLTGEGSTSIVVSLGLLLGGSVVLVPDRLGAADGPGLVVLGIGVLYTALAAAVFARSGQRELRTVLWILGLAVAAVGEGMLLGSSRLVLVYAASASLLAWVSVRVAERRLQVASLVYLVFAAALALVAEAPPTQLVVAREHPAHGVVSVLLVIAATAVFAWSLAWNERYRLQAVWVAGALAVYAASLLILEATQRLSHAGVATDFQRGQTLVSTFWGLLALASLYVGLKQRRGLLRGGGFILFAISLGKLFLFDLPSLSSVQRALSFLAVGAGLLLGGFFYQRLSSQYDERMP
jgi:uncharacterized membrane protein